MVFLAFSTLEESPEEVMYWIPPIRTKMTAMVPLTKIMALRMLSMTVLMSSSVLLPEQPLASLTDSGMLVAHLSVVGSSAETGMNDMIENTVISDVRMMVLNSFSNLI